MTIKRYQPRDTPYCEMDALPDGEYVRYEDYAELLGHVEAIGAGGVDGRRITSTPSNASAKITERSQKYLDDNLDADEHEAFIRWAREAHDYPEYALLILDSEWCQGAVAGWQGAIKADRQQRGEPDVAALVEALTELCDEIDKHHIHAAISETSILWFKRKACKALAAAPKFGEEE